MYSTIWIVNIETKTLSNFYTSICVYKMHKVYKYIKTLSCVNKKSNYIENLK
jgi:hypothetical protein